MNILIKEPEQRREEARTDCSAEKELNPQHYQQCCGTDVSKKQRGLNPEWIEANCRSLNQQEATEMLRYPARSGGIAIEGSNGQFQLRPDKPWGGKPRQKAPKYRTAAGDEYTALLPKHPTDPTYWTDIEALKQLVFYQYKQHLATANPCSSEGFEFFGSFWI